MCGSGITIAGGKTSTSLVLVKSAPGSHFGSNPGWQVSQLEGGSVASPRAAAAWSWQSTGWR
jgi:hypothetical protein